MSSDNVERDADTYSGKAGKGCPVEMGSNLFSGEFPASGHCFPVK